MKKIYKDHLLIINTVIAFILTIVVNGLANALPIGGMTTGAISDAYPNLFTPIGYTFAIWGLIYALLFSFTAYLVIVHWKKGFDGKMYLHRITLFFSISSLLNMGWILAWHYQFIWLSLVLMLGLLYTLIRINLILRNRTLPLAEEGLVCLPFRVYFGWITVATIANVTVVLVNLGMVDFGLGEEVVTAAVLIIGGLIGLMAIKAYNSRAYGLVVIWAYWGILAKHQSPQYFAGAYPLVINTLIVVLAVLGGFEVYMTVKASHRTKEKPQS